VDDTVFIFSALANLLIAHKRLKIKEIYMAFSEPTAYHHEQNYSETDRKTLGIHYTPDSIVDYIVRQTLTPLVKSPESLLNIKILDTACGSGLFLLKAFDILAEQWIQQFGYFNHEDARYLIENCLFGIDIDENAVHTAKQHLATKISDENQRDSLKFSIIAQDALSLKKNQQVQLDIGKNVERIGFDGQQFDCIIGNPPYVRIQNTSLSKNELQAIYQTAQGRFDLSSLFIELAEFLLKQGGRVGFVISNKILTTAATKTLRQFLATQFCIEEIVDLSDTKLFNAAILPLILIAERAIRNGNNIQYSHIIQTSYPTNSILQTDNLLAFLTDLSNIAETHVEYKHKCFQIRRFQTILPKQHTTWAFHHQAEHNLLVKLKSQSATTLEQVSEKISVGLKTTADLIFIKPMTQAFIAQHQFESQLIFPVLESENVKRWHCDWQSEKDLSVLYPYTESSNKVFPIDLADYPYAASYLRQHHAQLAARTYLQQARRQWYEIWVHHAPASFRQRKIVTPDISTRNCFALDEQGFFVNGTCFFIILKPDTLTFYHAILGLLNSNVIEYFHKVSCGNTLYAKRFRYWTSYIKHYPIPRKLLDSMELQTQLAQNTAQLIQATTQDEIVALEWHNNQLCYQLFDLTQEDIHEIEKKLASFKL
jgi:adenine-specific DNA-methyltransferase